jgi:sugar phosphate isomerase/epimerase
MGLGSAFVFSHLPVRTSAQPTSSFGKYGLGFQSYAVRESIEKDFPGTLKMMADMGYQSVEMCSPASYSKEGFGNLVSLKGEEIRKIINDVGLTCPSCHFTMTELREKLDDRIEFAKQLGINAMMCQSFWLPKSATIKQYRDEAKALNMLAAKISKAGLQTAFHNHEMEFAKVDGKLIYDALLEEFDPKLVKMQFQTEVVNYGYKAATYFNKFPGRFISAHMSDWTKDKKQVPIGRGVIDWKEFFEAAKKGGVETFYVEMEPNTFKESAAYIKSIQPA